jgi:acetylornithine/N-succinyldiaminopimelate aminotransferase
MGRTGEMFAFKHYDIEPDAISLAKSLGGGLPIGALVVQDKRSEILTAGSHASTFGGSPIVCAAALGVIEAIEEENLLENCVKMGKYLKSRISELSRKYGIISGVRGKGLMLGVETGLEDASVIADECVEQGLLINCTQKNILRIMPPVNVTREQIDMAVEKLSAVLEKI